MKIRSIGTKIVFITIFCIVAVASITTLILTYENRQTVNSIIASDTQASMVGIFSRTEDMKKTSLEIAKYIAEDPDVQNAIAQGDKDATIQSVNHVLQVIRADTEFVTIADINGNALARTHSDKSGDSVLSQQNIQEGLKGNRVSYIEPGTEIKLSVRSSNPVKDSNGQIIGVISTGYALDNPDFVDSIKANTGSEITVFKGDERFNTTIMKDGQRQIGTKLDGKIAQILLEQKQTYQAEANILGAPYYTYYSPILSQSGEVLGVFFAGKPIAEIKASINSATFFSVSIVIVLALLICIFLFFYLKKAVSDPIQKIRDTLVSVSEGILTVESPSNAVDEIGELSRASCKLTDIIHLLTKKMDIMSAEFKKGNIDATIDISEFQGVYQTVVEGMNQMTGELVEEVLLFSDCLMEIGDGNFSADIPPQPGKKATLNQTINTLRGYLQSVNRDIGQLVEQAINGNLSNRIDGTRYHGDWHQLIAEMNQLMDVISAPIHEASDVMKQVSMGNFEHKVAGDYKGDFLLIKESINNTVSHIASYINEITDILNAMAKDDLDHEIRREYVGQFADIKTSLNQIIAKFNHVISDIYISAEQVALGAKQVSDSGMTIAEGSSEQASSVEELSATITIIHEGTIRNTHNTKDADALSATSMESAAKGDQDMKNMLTAMEDIKKSSGKIHDIIQVIDNIATQSNLLAINAAIEAARSGVHGKGFAVVAEEVGNLAARSQQAAKGTAALIEETIEKINLGTGIAYSTAETLQTIVNEISQIAGIMSKISNSSQEQAESIGQITIGIAQITEVVQNNSTISEQSVASSEQLTGQAEKLKNLVSVFKTKNRG